MYYDSFFALCEAYGKTPYAVAKATGIATATLTHWKKGLYTPKDEKLEKIAEYFGVSLDYLKGKTERTIELDRQEILEHAFDDRPEMRTLFMIAQKAPKEDIEWVIAKLKTLSEENGRSDS